MSPIIATHNCCVPHESHRPSTMPNRAHSAEAPPRTFPEPGEEVGLNLSKVITKKFSNQDTREETAEYVGDQTFDIIQSDCEEINDN